MSMQAEIYKLSVDKAQHVKMREFAQSRVDSPPEGSSDGCEKRMVMIWPPTACRTRQAQGNDGLLTEPHSSHSRGHINAHAVGHSY